MTKQRITNLQWHKDSSGWYWVADVTGGKTGSYYDVGENNQRPTRQKQENEIKQEYQNEGS